MTLSFAYINFSCILNISFHPPTSENATLYKQVFNPDSHGHSGPIHTSFSEWVHDGELPFQQVSTTVRLVLSYNVSSHLYNQAMLSNGVQNAKDPVSLKSRRADDSFLPDEFCAKYGGDVSCYIVYYQRLNPKILCSSLLETTCPSAASTPNPSLDHTPLR